MRATAGTCWSAGTGALSQRSAKAVRRRGAKFCARKSSTMSESTVTALLPSFFIATDLR